MDDILMPLSHKFVLKRQEAKRAMGQWMDLIILVKFTSCKYPENEFFHEIKRHRITSFMDFMYPGDSTEVQGNQPDLESNQGLTD